MTPTTGGAAVIGSLVPILVGTSVNLLPAYFLSQTVRYGTVTITYITTAVTALVNNGVPPYTYQWTVTPPVGITAPNTVVPDTPTSPSTIFHAYLERTVHGTFKAICTVTDSVGDSAVSPEVSITV